MMKRSWMIGLGAAAVLATAPFVGSMPVLASLQEFGTNLAAAVQQKPKVALNLVGEKQQIKKDAQGQDVITWQAVGEKVSVQPGDVLRFTLNSKNEGDRPAANLVLTQPIPKGTQYVLNTAIANIPAQTTYSIDGGRSFVANPTVAVTLPDGKVETRPAPASAYTHVRWTVSQPLAALAATQVAYQVAVR